MEKGEIENKKGKETWTRLTGRRLDRGNDDSLTYRKISQVSHG